jgi:hypothetical protein
MRFVPDGEGQGSVRDWGLHMNAMQGQRKSSGDLFNDGGEVEFVAKSGRDALLNIGLLLPLEYRKWGIQLDSLTYTAVCHSIMPFRISLVTERDTPTPTASVHIPPAKKVCHFVPRKLSG